MEEVEAIKKLGMRVATLKLERTSSQLEGFVELVVLEGNMPEVMWR